MCNIIRTSQFKKDVKKALRRNKDMDKLKILIFELVKKHALPAKYKDHALTGNYRDCRDCHIEPDWILIYQLREHEVHLIRTGTHADLFR